MLPKPYIHPTSIIYFILLVFLNLITKDINGQSSALASVKV